MRIQIDENAGFCFGVTRAIKKAEELLLQYKHLYCLGAIVHNHAEVERLEKMGLTTITKEQFKELKNCRVLIRAHGEPPETYTIAKANNIELIDASCKVVLKIQDRIKNTFTGANNQIVIFGKAGHAEVNGLVGQTGGSAIVVKTLADLDNIDFTKPVSLFSQTTMSLPEFELLGNEIRNRMEPHFIADQIPLTIHDTICRQVSNRVPNIRSFAMQNDAILFVSGKESSNGKVLFDECKNTNPNTYFIASVADIDLHQIQHAKNVGICGATSTPSWLMKEVAEYVAARFPEKEPEHT